MKFSPIILLLVACTIGVYCNHLGYDYFFYPVRPKTGSNLGWYLMIFLFLALLFPNLFGAFGTGLQNFAGALTGNGRGGGGNGSYNGGGNVPPMIMGG